MSVSRKCKFLVSCIGNAVTAVEVAVSSWDTKGDTVPLLSLFWPDRDTTQLACMDAYSEQTAFHYFHRLRAARSPCKGVAVAWVTNKLKERATRRYSRAISHSIECDDRILVFASHATDLAKSLKENYHYNEVLTFTNKMQREIRRGRRAAEGNTSDFISVRTSLGLLKLAAYPNPCVANTSDRCDKAGISLRRICVDTMARWFGHRCTGDLFTESQSLKDTINNLIGCMDTLVKKTVWDWSLVEQELTRLQEDIVAHKSTLSDKPNSTGAMSQQQSQFDDVSDEGKRLDSLHSTTPPLYVSAEKGGSGEGSDLEKLVISALEAFRVLEPWCLAEYPKDAHLVIRIMMAHLKKQSHRYFDAIDKSIACSDRGIVFSEHAIDLCDALEKKMPVDEILKFIERMETEVSKAQKDVEKTRGRFVEVRKQLMKISESIPRQKEVVERDEQFAQRAVMKWGVAKRWTTWIIEHCALDDGAKAAIAGIGAALSGLPHVGIILPAAIPAAIIAARITATGARAIADFAIDNREKHVVRCEEALPELADTEGKITLVIESIDTFATWWQTMSRNLQDIKAKVKSKDDIREIVAQIHQRLICLCEPFRGYSSQVYTHSIHIWLS
ncbi:hypothetical protein K438DRAFT_1960202 [Mycena galopus ATCC 62051]|nr:hypothetical protein K438DRAFT_1960202 [Mycena galopus ATCC 62051]